MNVSTISVLSQLGMAAIGSVTGLSPPAVGLHPKLQDSRASSTIPYVAFGDSITTGSSIETCREDRQRSPWGCLENPTAATPYPNIIAQWLGLSFSNKPIDYKAANLEKKPLGLYRAGTWGYTIREAANAKNPEGNNGWISQLEAISRATQLVTGSLGINDLRFSNVTMWAKLYLKPGGDHITSAVRQKIKERSSDFDKLFESLKIAKGNGATVVVGLYYNPYDTEDPLCNDLKTIGDRMVDTLDNELQKRAQKSGFHVADFRNFFDGHGSGSAEPYVFGTECRLSSAVISMLPKWMGGGGGKQALAIKFDPHPNNQGTAAMARAMLREFYYAD